MIDFWNFINLLWKFIECTEDRNPIKKKVIADWNKPYAGKEQIPFSWSLQRINFRPTQTKLAKMLLDPGATLSSLC